MTTSNILNAMKSDTEPLKWYHGTKWYQREKGAKWYKKEKNPMEVEPKQWVFNIFKTQLNACLLETSEYLPKYIFVI